jgi:hypothetical protein
MNMNKILKDYPVQRDSKLAPAGGKAGNSHGLG